MLIDYVSNKSLQTILKVNFKQDLSPIYLVCNEKILLKFLKIKILHSNYGYFTNKIFRYINSLNNILTNMFKQKLRLTIDILKCFFDKYSQYL